MSDINQVRSSVQVMVASSSSKSQYRLVDTYFIVQNERNHYERNHFRLDLVESLGAAQNEYFVTVFIKFSAEVSIKPKVGQAFRSQETVLWIELVDRSARFRGFDANDVVRQALEFIDHYSDDDIS